MSGTKKKTILRTIRLSEEVDDLLERDAQEHNISVNGLISKIMTKYTEWDRYTEKLGFVSFSKIILKAAINEMADETLEKIAKAQATQRTKTWAMWAFGKSSFETLLKAISLMGKYEGIWSIETKCNRDCVITLHHDIGRKGSLYTKYFFDTVVREEMRSIPTIDTTDDTVIVSFPVPLESRTPKNRQ